MTKPSVHMMAIEPSPCIIDEALSRDMALVREIAALGLRVRAVKKIKTRQPLACLTVVLTEARELDDELVALIRDEVNVARVEFCRRDEVAVDYAVKPNFAALGKRLGARMKATAAVIRAADPHVMVQALDTDGHVVVDVEGTPVVLSKGDIEVTITTVAGDVATSPVGVVILDTQLTPELRDEGLFRDIVALLQAARKEQHLAYTEQVDVCIVGNARVCAVCEARMDWLRDTLLARSVYVGERLDAQLTQATAGDEVVWYAVDPLPC